MESPTMSRLCLRGGPPLPPTRDTEEDAVERHGVCDALEGIRGLVDEAVCESLSLSVTFSVPLSLSLSWLNKANGEGCGEGVGWTIENECAVHAPRVVMRYVAERVEPRTCMRWR